VIGRAQTQAKATFGPSGFMRISGAHRVRNPRGIGRGRLRHTAKGRMGSDWVGLAPDQGGVGKAELCVDKVGSEREGVLQKMGSFLPDVLGGNGAKPLSLRSLGIFRMGSFCQKENYWAAGFGL
jgi:hypothetical protein